jgi:hypothetical protein
MRTRPERRICAGCVRAFQLSGRSDQTVLVIGSGRGLGRPFVRVAWLDLRTVPFGRYGHTDWDRCCETKLGIHVVVPPVATSRSPTSLRMRVSPATVEIADSPSASL